MVDHPRAGSGLESRQNGGCKRLCRAANQLVSHRSRSQLGQSCVCLINNGLEPSSKLCRGHVCCTSTVMIASMSTPGKN